MVTYLESQATVGVTIIPAEVKGRILIVYYWIEGMASWENLETYPTPAKDGDAIHTYVVWINDGTTPVVGNILAQYKAPDYHVYAPNAVLNQDKSANPGSGWGVQFAPVTLDHSGSWEFFGMLTLDGEQFIDFKTFNFVVQEETIVVGTSITLSLSPLTVEPNGIFTWSGKLRRDDGGSPGNQTIKLRLNGNIVDSTTCDINGNFSATETAPSAEGAYSYRSHFGGATLGLESLEASMSPEIMLGRVQ